MSKLKAVGALNEALDITALLSGLDTETEAYRAVYGVLSETKEEVAAMLRKAIDSVDIS